MEKENPNPIVHESVRDSTTTDDLDLYGSGTSRIRRSMKLAFETFKRNALPRVLLGAHPAEFGADDCDDLDDVRHDRIVESMFSDAADDSSASSSSSSSPSAASVRQDPFTAEEVFDMIRNINDPEHPFTLEQLRVAQLELIDVDNENGTIDLMFTPTIPHCSLARMIGLCLRVKLLRALPQRFKVRITITPGKHAQEHEVNKQLNDKERVAAALENAQLLSTVDRCIRNSDPLETTTSAAAGGAETSGKGETSKRALQSNIGGTQANPVYS